MTKKSNPGGEFTPADWKWASKNVADLSSKIHETPALKIFLKKVLFGARSGAFGMPSNGVWLFGEAGSGKTTAMRECERQLSAETELDTGTPSLFITLLPGPTMHTLVRDLLLLLDYPFSTARTFAERAVLLFEALRKRRVRVIFIDEIQHVVEGNRTVNQSEIRDFLKRLLDETNVCLVISGLPSAQKLRDNDQQLASRVPGEVRLSTNFNQKEGREFIAALLALGPIPFATNAAERVQMIFSAREKTSARLVSRVIEEATKIAALTRSALVLDMHVSHAVNMTFLRAAE